jgi:hypothetical protein
MNRLTEADIRAMIVKLRAEHRDLDTEIVALETQAVADQLQVRRLKKRKLTLKDQIAQLEDQLQPDIIA